MTVTGMIAAVAWPIVAVILVLFVTFSGTLRGWLVELVRRLRKVTAFGVDVELNEQVSAQVKELTEDAFSAFRKRILVEFDRLVHVYQIADKRNRLVDNYVRPLLLEQKIPKETVSGIRCTIHVEDVLFTETIYQLLDYYPRSSDHPRGRTSSVRRGIVGKAWRLKDHVIDAEVSVDPRVLIEVWGMTDDEAASTGLGRQSMAAVLLCNKNGDRVAVVYLDSADKNTFSADHPGRHALVQRIVQGADDLGLTSDVAKLISELRRRSPHIALFTDP